MVWLGRYGDRLGQVWPHAENQQGRWSRSLASCIERAAGGGLKCGQALGATDRLGGEAVSRPVTFQEVFATLSIASWGSISNRAGSSIFAAVLNTSSNPVCSPLGNSRSFPLSFSPKPELGPDLASGEIGSQRRRRLN
jgi:hypothetical protein